MKIELRFIFCREYEFEGKKGITCSCYDENSGKIVKVKTDVIIPAEFGDVLSVNAVPNGNYLKYQYVA